MSIGGFGLAVADHLFKAVNSWHHNIWFNKVKYLNSQGVIGFPSTQTFFCLITVLLQKYTYDLF